MNDVAPSRLQLWGALSATLLVAAVLVAPVFRSPPRDSFPLSTFPMFSSLIEPVVDVSYIVGISPTGEDVTLDPETIAGTDEVIIAGSIVEQAVRNGEEALTRLCDAAAARAASKPVIRLEVRTDRLHAVEWWSDDRAPMTSVTHARCDVP